MYERILLHACMRHSYLYSADMALHNHLVCLPCLISLNVQDLLRLIEIEGVDINPCGGTHLSCTSQLQVLKLVGLEKSRGQGRLRFMVGGRVIAALGSALTREAALNKVSRLSMQYI